MSVHLALEYVVSRHREREEVRIGEMAGVLEISKKECVEILQMANEKMKEIGFALVPGSRERVDEKEKPIGPEKITTEYTHVLSSFGKCNFVYVVKTLKCSEEENLVVNPHIYDVVFVSMLIFLNGSDLEYDRAVIALKEVEKEEKILKKIISEKYIKKYKKQETHYIRLDWKFFFEFPNFSPEEYLQSFQNRLYSAENTISDHPAKI